MLFGPSMSTMIDGDYYGDGDVSIGAGNKNSAKSDASAKQATKADISVGGDSDKDSATKISGFLPSITVGSNADAYTGMRSGFPYGPGYRQYAAGRYNALAKSYAKAMSAVVTSQIDGCCPGLTDSSQCPATCPKDQVCDGEACVYPKDCPCFSGDIRRTTGSVWKEDNGCKNCMCIGGEIECAKEACEIESCPAGEKLETIGDACCPVCVEDPTSCTDSESEIHSLGDKWTSKSDECEVCECTTDGVTCAAKSCPASEMPTCEAGHKLITSTVNCCPCYECICDTSVCTSSMPSCPEHHSAVITNPSECCPEYECVCRRDTCPPRPICKMGERCERTNDESECCGEYKCTPIGCVDESGVLHDVYTTWQSTTDSCQECACVGDQNIRCRAKSCPHVSKPVCASGIEPSIVYDIEGCCASYVCDFVCRGSAGSTRIHTFDGYSYARSCPCSHVLARDSFGLDFEVSVRREECGGSICTNALVIKDKLSAQTMTVYKDAEIDLSGLTSFDVTESALETTITIKSAGVKVIFDRSSDTWSVSVPSRFSGKTEGLCGLADGEVSNDLWVGSYAVTTVSTGVCANATDMEVFFNHYLDADASAGVSCLAGADISAEVALSSDDTRVIIARAFCAKLFKAKMFGELADVVDQKEYLEDCVRVSYNSPVRVYSNKITSNWPGCSVFASYAKACGRAGKCISWRTEDFCPFTGCGADMQYEACGASVCKSCSNYKTYEGLNVDYNTEGCFCTAGKVMQDGECVSVPECGVCRDEMGYARHNGEQWRYHDDACTVATCMPDSSIVQSQIECPAAPACMSNETLAKVDDNSECCPVYTCLPNNHEDKCAGLTCPSRVRPKCDIGERLTATTCGPNDCCIDYSCTCDSDSCPSTPILECEEGEELEVINADSCCPTATCMCKPDTCTPPPACSEDGYLLRVVSEGRCCSEYECVCERSTCPVTDDVVCSGGEVQVASDPSACCATIVCECDPAQCPPAITECGPGFKRVQVSKDGDCCEVFECQCDETQCPAQLTTSCPTLPGYRIIKTGVAQRSAGLPECCPSVYEEVCTCDVSSCPVSDVVCEAYERKYVTNLGECCPEYACECDSYKCDRGVYSCPRGQHLVEQEVNKCCSTTVCECDECSEPEACKEGYGIYDVTDSCGCVTRTCTPPTECVYYGDSHAPGLTWMEDICTECTCSGSPNSVGEYETSCTAIKCGTCSDGYTYVPVAGQCCGDCVPTVCHYESKQYAPGQTWTASDNACTTCECMIDPMTNEVFSQCNAPQCPPTDGMCDPEDIMTTSDGCCTYCASRQTDKCRPINDFFEEIEFDGCRSTERVNVTMCGGQCTSASVFSSALGRFQKQCSCCSAVKTEERKIDLTCPDDSIKTYTYEVATECSCHATSCDAGDPQN
jgi:hypothetical protein